MSARKAKPLTIIEIRARVDQMPIKYARGLAVMFLADMSATRCKAYIDNCDLNEFIDLGIEVDALEVKIAAMRPVYEELKTARSRTCDQYKQIRRWNRMVARKHAVLLKLTQMVDLPHIKRVTGGDS